MKHPPASSQNSKISKNLQVIQYFNLTIFLSKKALGYLYFDKRKIKSLRVRHMFSNCAQKLLNEFCSPFYVTDNLKMWLSRAFSIPFVLCRYYIIYIYRCAPIFMQCCRATYSVCMRVIFYISPAPQYERFIQRPAGNYFIQIPAGIKDKFNAPMVRLLLLLYWSQETAALLYTREVPTRAKEF